ncbi:MAG TPA: uridine kinase [Propionibacteriaceae bacterium]|nr:uridine kinase [Propionibacteriaceae bacterium]
MSRTVILVAGPSGSGKSRLSGHTGVPQLRLDDFYFDIDRPGMPCVHFGGGDTTQTMVDWDDVASWDLAAAVEALASLVETGRATTPVYDISTSRATGSREVDLDDSGSVLAEGIFAPDLLAPCRERGLSVLPIWLDRPRELNFLRRLRRDLAEHRKPPAVLVRRGVALYRHEPSLRAEALALGFEPMSMAQAQGAVRAFGCLAATT